MAGSLLVRRTVIQIFLGNNARSAIIVLALAFLVGCQKQSQSYETDLSGINAVGRFKLTLPDHWQPEIPKGTFEGGPTTVFEFGAGDRLTLLYYLPSTEHYVSDSKLTFEGLSAKRPQANKRVVNGSTSFLITDTGSAFNKLEGRYTSITCIKSGFIVAAQIKWKHEPTSNSMKSVLGVLDSMTLLKEKPIVDKVSQLKESNKEREVDLQSLDSPLVLIVGRDDRATSN